MEPPTYPFATLAKDGFQLAVVEQGDTQRVFAAPLAPDEKRFAAQPGDVVKLIFEYREGKKALGSGQEFDAENMWVKITGYGDGYLIGKLDSSPQFTELLKSGDTVAVHPKHVIAFWHD